MVRNSVNQDQFVEYKEGQDKLINVIIEQGKETQEGLQELIKSNSDLNVDVGKMVQILTTFNTDKVAIHKRITKNEKNIERMLWGLLAMIGTIVTGVTIMWLTKLIK